MSMPSTALNRYPGNCSCTQNDHVRINTEVRGRLPHKQIRRHSLNRARARVQHQVLIRFRNNADRVGHRVEIETEAEATKQRAELSADCVATPLDVLIV